MSLGKPFLCWSCGEPPDDSEVDVLERSWGVRDRALNATNRAEEKSPQTFAF